MGIGQANEGEEREKKVHLIWERERGEEGGEREGGGRVRER